MRAMNRLACFAASSVLMGSVLAQESTGPIHVPNRPATSLFRGEQGVQPTQVQFDPDTRTVTIKARVQDSNGYFIPNIHRENFVVYDNGVRQQTVRVDVEHARVSVGLLLEHGGHYRALNEAIGTAVATAASEFVAELGPGDSVAIWKYGDSVEEVAKLTPDRDAPSLALANLGAPPFSEQNFYDALIATLPRAQAMGGSKALLVISSGLDTFSKATFQDALRAVRQSDVPIYAISLGSIAQSDAPLSLHPGPYARLDWKRAESELGELARASGGRMYSPQSTLELSGIYDDLMENLRVRYVITYRPTEVIATNRPRRVRIELVDSKSGGPLAVVDTNGKAVRPKFLVEGSYTPHP